MIPLTLITGFLGAGKTTVLNRMLRQRLDAGEPLERLAVVVNEFAELGLDGVQLPAGPYRKWELNRGSIFCVCLRTDFIALLEEIVRDVNPDEIWVEATGIADVGEVFKMISVPTLRNTLFLRTNICLVDPTTILKILPTLRAARQQVVRADALVVNKVDLVDEVDLVDVEHRVRELNGTAPLFRCTHGQVDFTGIPSFTVPRLDTRAFGGHPPQPIASVSITEEWCVPYEAFERWWRARRELIWRIKGRLATPDGPVWVEGTLDGLQALPCPSERELAAPTAIALIGPGLKQEVVRAELRALSL